MTSVGRIIFLGQMIGERTLSAIQSELSKSYDVGEERCRTESIQFLSKLKGAGFVEGI